MVEIVEQLTADRLHAVAKALCGIEIDLEQRHRRKIPDHGVDLGMQRLAAENRQIEREAAGPGPPPPH
ncbi:MAG: hypothetical protein I4N50_13825, partial [Rhizobium sp.]|nr:hypothetical protein [Rhizobium sp.]